jgi:ribonuclease T2
MLQYPDVVQPPVPLPFDTRTPPTVRRCWRATAAAALTLCAGAWSGTGLATVPLDGAFLAARDCPATVSTKQRDPAAGVRLEPGRSYRLLGKNKSDATHYQVVIVGARPAERWVEVGCGTPVGAEGGHSSGLRAGEPGDGEAMTRFGSPAEGQGASPGLPGAQAGARPEAARSKPGAFVLALSWQPAFCEINRRKAECRDQTPRRPDASRFSLHGLWPQPRDNAYCGVDAHIRRMDQQGDWSALPALDLRPATRERLATLMPGARSGLDRHEWINHGTCYGTDADTYFGQAMALVEQLNASPIRNLFADNLGNPLSSSQIRAAFDAAFGRGIGDRVRVVCDDGMISELRLSLKGAIGDESRIGPLMRAAVPLSSRCRGGRVDEAGFE